MSSNHETPSKAVGIVAGFLAFCSVPVLVGSLLGVKASSGAGFLLWLGVGGAAGYGSYSVAAAGADWAIRDGARRLLNLNLGGFSAARATESSARPAPMQRESAVIPASEALLTISVPDSAWRTVFIDGRCGVQDCSNTATRRCSIHAMPFCDTHAYVVGSVVNEQRCIRCARRDALLHRPDAFLYTDPIDVEEQRRLAAARKHCEQELLTEIAEVHAVEVRRHAHDACRALLYMVAEKYTTEEVLANLKTMPNSDRLRVTAVTTTKPNAAGVLTWNSRAIISWFCRYAASVNLPTDTVIRPDALLLSPFDPRKRTIQAWKLTAALGPPDGVTHPAGDLFLTPTGAYDLVRVDPRLTSGALVQMHERLRSIGK